MKYAYPANFESDDVGDTGFTVTFDGMPGVTYGRTLEEALREAGDLLVTIMTIYVENGQAIPQPEPANGRPTVSVSILEAVKLALHDAMVAEGVTNVELAQRLGLNQAIVRRLRDPLHVSKIDQVEAALRALGRRAVIEFEAA